MLVAVSDEETNEFRVHLFRITILTVVEDVPSADAFRPAFAEISFKTMFSFSQVDTSILQNLEVAESPPDWASMEARVERFSPDLVPNWNRDHMETQEHGPLYGRDLCKSEGRAYLMVNSDYPLESKMQMLVGLIQRGVDRYGLLQYYQFPW